MCLHQPHPQQKYKLPLWFPPLWLGKSPAGWSNMKPLETENHSCPLKRHQAMGHHSLGFAFLKGRDPTSISALAERTSGTLQRFHNYAGVSHLWI